jgi:imidazolonepropionase-like amidohydrolase
VTQGPLLVVAGLLVDGTGGPPRTDTGVLLDGGRVAAVGPVDDVRRHRLAGEARVLDCSESTVVPGLIDGHVHLAWGEQSDPAWAAVAELTAQRSAWALAAAQAALAAGVTTVRDCGAKDGVTLELRQVVASGVTAASRVLACGPCLTTTGGHGDFLGVTADDAGELRRAIRALAARRPDAIKVMATGGSMDPHTNRRRAQYSVDELRAVVDEAARLDMHIVAHANATEGIRRAVEAGVRTIAHCNFLATQDGRLDVDPEVVGRMREQQTYVDLNLGAAMVPLRDRDAACEPAASDVPRDRWDLLCRAGLTDRVYFTSDQFGPGVRHFPALLAAAGRRWRLSAEELVWRASGLAADALGLGPDEGRLTDGARADLVVLDGDLGADVDTLLKVRAVFQAGVPPK